MVHGSADSDAMKDLGKPGAGELHARFDERGLETEHGLGTAAPATKCVDSAGFIGHRASPRLYPYCHVSFDDADKPGLDDWV